VKVGDLIQFRVTGGFEEDYSPAALVIERFSIADECIWVVMCAGMRCMVGGKFHEVRIISESRRFSKVR
jgi:hypothetical protein